MTRMIVIASIIAVGALARDASAEEVCKTTQLKTPALTLSEMYLMADGHAKAWKSDAVLAQAGTTSEGPLQPNGGSVDWSLLFYSDSAKESVSITTSGGTYRCWADEGSAGRIPDLKPAFMRDGAKLYALAKENGEALLAQGYTVSIGIVAAPGTRHATWRINYATSDGVFADITVIVDANTGTVEKVLKLKSV